MFQTHQDSCLGRKEQSKMRVKAETTRNGYTGTQSNPGIKR